MHTRDLVSGRSSSDPVVPPFEARAFFGVDLSFLKDDLVLDGFASDICGLGVVVEDGGVMVDAGI